jgi:glycosyltransferase involved in cell wall biosynthesis
VTAERSRRIVHAIARLNVGGAALHVMELAAEQARRGHDVLVVAGTLAEGEESMEWRAEELGLRLVRMPELQRELSLRHDAAAIRKLRRLLDGRRPDVLHTHTAKAGSAGRIAALSLPRPRRPRALVHTFHGHVLRGYFSARRSRAFALVERALGSRTGALVAVSEQVRDDLVSLGVAPPGRIEVIPYGFDLSGRVGGGERERVRAELGVDGQLLVGWVGRLTAIKQPLDAVRTFARLRSEGVDAVLAVAGDGEERAATEELARELGVLPSVRFLGYVKDLAGLYAAVDALLLTSLNEGTPVAAIEALAAERPVVATRVGGVPAVVGDGEDGFLAASGDVDGLAHGLAELARDPALREALGRHGAERMRERYSAERMVDEIDALYDRLLAR